MTKEEIVEGLKLLEDNMVHFDEIQNDKGEWIDVHELLFEAIQALSQEPCDKCAMKNSNSNYCKNCTVTEYHGEKVSVPTKFIEQEPCDDAVSREAVEQMIKSEMPERGAWEIGGNIGDIEKQTVCEVCVDLLQGLNELPSDTHKSGKWIPVSERLPEESDCCLCCDKDGYMTIGGISKWSKEWYFDDDEVDMDVVAWMPLPEPYKAESEDKE